MAQPLYAPFLDALETRFRETEQASKPSPKDTGKKKKILSSFAEFKNVKQEGVEPKKVEEPEASASDKQAVMDFVKAQANDPNPKYMEDQEEEAALLDRFLGEQEERPRSQEIPARGEDQAYDKSMDKAFGQGEEKLKEFVAPVKGEPTTSEMAEAPKAKVIATPEEVDRLFKVTHGSSFDPKSKLDVKKRQEIESLLIEKGGLGDMTPNQFALQIYRKFKYV